jgi:hypothetical protein
MLVSHVSGFRHGGAVIADAIKKDCHGGCASDCDKEV